MLLFLRSLLWYASFTILRLSTSITLSLTMGYAHIIPKKVVLSTHFYNLQFIHMTCSQGFHPRNRFRFGYDFVELTNHDETIKKFLLPSPAKPGDFTINFSNAEAVKCLNKCLLRWGYGIQYWNFSGNGVSGLHFIYYFIVFS